MDVLAANEYAHMTQEANSSPWRIYVCSIRSALNGRREINSIYEVLYILVAPSTGLSDGLDKNVLQVMILDDEQ